MIELLPLGVTSSLPSSSLISDLDVEDSADVWLLVWFCSCGLPVVGLLAIESWLVCSLSELGGPVDCVEFTLSFGLTSSMAVCLSLRSGTVLASTVLPFKSSPSGFNSPRAP